MGEVDNKGWEFDLGYKNLEGDFKYSVTVNATFLKNNVVSYGDSGAYVLGSQVGTQDYATRYDAGHPAWYFYGYKAIGIFQSMQDVNNYNVGLVNGKILKDNNGNEIINPSADAQLGPTGKRQIIQKSACPGDVKYADLDNRWGHFCNR